MSRIELRHLMFRYKKQQPEYVLKDLCMSVEDGQSVGIIGSNGVGKSTLLKVLTGLLLEYEGGVFIDGLAVQKQNLDKIRRKLGYVFQDSDSQLFMNTVYEDVAFGPLNYGIKEDEVKIRAQKALQETHIENLADRQIYRLSGGEKKLVSIAGILAIGADILLMDEPSAALDPSNRENLIEIIRNLKGVKVIASHDLDFIYDTCERTVLLSNGRIVFDGDTKEALQNRELLETNGLRLPLSFRFI